MVFRQRTLPMKTVPRADTNAPESQTLDRDELALCEAARQSALQLKLTFDNWMTIGRAVAALRNHADRLIEKGWAARTTFPRLIEQQGLGQLLDKAKMSRLLAIMDRLPEVQAWHATLTLKEQSAWASPDSIMRKCPAFNEPAEPKPPQPTVRHELADLQVSDLQARVAELEKELAGPHATEVSDHHVVVRQSGLEDLRNAYAETLLRLPRSQRLPEMRALAEKVLAIGTVKSRRRKLKVTEAAAQTTEIEPASEFDVEPEEKPDDLEGDQSEATVVGDTIRIPSVTVAEARRRKRKSKTTEPDNAG
jgi:hypothetical protein